MVDIEYLLIVVIEFGAGEDESTVEEGGNEHVLLEADEMIGHLARYANGKEVAVVPRVPLDCSPLVRASDFLTDARGGEVRIRTG